MQSLSYLILSLYYSFRYNNKTYKVDDILWDKHPSESFTTPEGTTITLADYYKQQYGKVIKDQNQPLLVNKGKKGRKVKMFH